MPNTGRRKGRRGRLAFTCPLCQRTSYHPKDVENAFCGCCGGPFLPRDCEHTTARKEVVRGR